MQETKFHTHIEQAKLVLLFFNFMISDMLAIYLFIYYKYFCEVSHAAHIRKLFFLLLY